MFDIKIIKTKFTLNEDIKELQQFMEQKMRVAAHEFTQKFKSKIVSRIRSEYYGIKPYTHRLEMSVQAINKDMSGLKQYGGVSARTIGIKFVEGVNTPHLNTHVGEGNAIINAKGKLLTIPITGSRAYRTGKKAMDFREEGSFVVKLRGNTFIVIRKGKGRKSELEFLYVLKKQVKVPRRISISKLTEEFTSEANNWFSEAYLQYYNEFWASRK